MTKQTDTAMSATDRPVLKIEITDDVIRAAVHALWDSGYGTDFAYAADAGEAVRLVFAAIQEKSSRHTTQMLIVLP